MPGKTEQQLASYAAILKSLRPLELEVEYTRLMQMPPVVVASGDMIAIMLDERWRKLGSNTVVSKEP